MTSITLNEGQLGPGSYRWRVRVADGINWIKVNNQSRNQWQTFTTGSKLTESEYRYLIPLETDDGWQIDEISLPAYGLITRLQEDGKWKRSEIEKEDEDDK